MMANSFIDRLNHPHLAPTFDSKLVLGLEQGTAFDHWKGRGTSAEEWKPKLGEQPHIIPKLDSPEPTGIEQIVLAKDDSRFSGDADAVVITAVKECVATLQRCIASGKYDDAINHTYTLRGLVCGYADFKCGTIFALKDSKK